VEHKAFFFTMPPKVLKELVQVSLVTFLSAILHHLRTQWWVFPN